MESAKKSIEESNVSMIKMKEETSKTIKDMNQTMSKTQ